MTSGLPTVFAGAQRATRTREGTSGGSTRENASGAVEAVTHLLERRRRRIATITGPLDMVAGARTGLTGWRTALTSYGRRSPTTLSVEHGTFSMESGNESMARLLAQEPAVDAVFAACDLMAAGAIQALTLAGRRIPDDVCVIGFDDSDTAVSAEPPLTSVAQDVERAGYLMAELLLEHVGGATSPRQEVLPTHLVVRASS